MKCLQCVKENETFIANNKPGYGYIGNQGVCYRHNRNNDKTNNKINDEHCEQTVKPNLKERVDFNLKAKRILENIL